MTDGSLRHLALVIDGVNLTPGREPAIFAQFSRLIGLCFARAARLSTLSLFSPELQRCAGVAPTGLKARNAAEKELGRLADSARLAGASLYFIGFTERLPDPWPSLLAAASSPSFPSKRVNVFFNYSARAEIAAAAGDLLASRGEGTSDEAVFSRFLLTGGQPDPDLVIHAGGPLEPKDFLLWQSSYAEIWHQPGSGLDFCEDDLARAFEAYSSRERRFGKV